MLSMEKTPRAGSKTARVLNHLKTKGDITTREMEIKPFWLNCPYRTIDNLRDIYGISILDEYITKTKRVKIDGKFQKVTDRYKRYFLEKLDGLSA